MSCWHGKTMIGPGSDKKQSKLNIFLKKVLTYILWDWAKPNILSISTGYRHDWVWQVLSKGSSWTPMNYWSTLWRELKWWPWHGPSPLLFFNSVCHHLCVAQCLGNLAENTPEWLHYSFVGYHTWGHSSFPRFILLFLLLSSNISQQIHIAPWFRGSEYMVCHVITQYCNNDQLQSRCI